MSEPIDKTAKHDPSRNEYMRSYQLKKYHKRMKAAKKALGGKCSKCDSTRNLQLDHKNPDGKEFVVSKLWSVPEAEFNKEVKKCRLLCRSCHGKHTGKQRETGIVKSTPGKTDYDSKGRKKHKKASMESLISRINKVASSDSLVQRLVTVAGSLTG